jgi:hypothetical protein
MGFGYSIYNANTGKNTTYGLGSGDNNNQSGGGGMNNYGLPLSQYSNGMGQRDIPNRNLYGGQDANTIRNLPTAYTPEQLLQMKNNAANQNAVSAQGMNDRIRELMAAQGLSGSGSETGAMTKAMLGSNANLQNAMSGIDMENSRLGLQNQYAKAGLLNQLMGFGMQENNLAEQARQFNQGQYNNMYQFGKNFDYNKGLDDKSLQMYKDQLAQMMAMYGMGGGGSGNTPGFGGGGSSGHGSNWRTGG